jgi:hypothetical protein
MAGVGKLVYRSSGNDAGKLCYKASGADAGKLVYKVDAGRLTTITFAWGTDGKDLDICAFWTGAPSMVMGYGYNTSKQEQISGAYHITYSGDERGTNVSEWVKIKMTPWSAGARTFDIHLNFFGYDPSTYPANKCIVVASQENGGSIILRDVNCGTNDGSTTSRKALTRDPGVRVTFDATGHLQSMEVI